MMAAASRPKVTVKLAYDNGTPSSRPPSRPPSRTTLSRPPSPLKSRVSPAPTSFRPKAKVNSSATPISTRKPPAATWSKYSSSPSNTAPASASVTPRPASPTKPPPRVRDGTLSPTFQPRAGPTVKSTLRPRSSPAPPELLRPSLTSGSSDANRFNPDKRVRNGSMSLHHAMSFSSLHGSNSSSVGSYSPPLTPTEPMNYSEHERSHSPSIRIKSKVSEMVKAAGTSLSPPSSFPSHPTTCVAKHRARIPSVSSNASFQHSPPSQPPVFYPITTATPAANPHRFATPRPSPRKPVHLPQSSSLPRDDVCVDYGRRNGFAKVDPANIPLPANSPPASAVSFSSRSSVSQSSPDSVDSNDDHTHDIEQLRSTLDTLIRYNEMEDDLSGQDRGSENHLIGSHRTVEAEAKSIRKIADLEITNRSLLAINASLETTKHRQAKEIWELRRKLRESRLILPPRAYQAVKSSTDHHDTTDEDDNADGEEEDEDGSKDGDQVYKRIKVMLEGLLDSGRRALETTTADFSQGAKGVAKVLNPEEVRTWRDSSGGTPDHETEIEQEDVNTIHQGIPSFSPHAVSPDSENLESEDEVEAMVLSSNVSSRSPPALPILITESL